MQDAAKHSAKLPVKLRGNDFRITWCRKVRKSETTMKFGHYIPLLLCLFLATPALAQDPPEKKEAKKTDSKQVQQKKKESVQKAVKSKSEEPQPGQPQQKEKSDDPNVLRGLKMKDIVGNDVDLSKYQGKVILVVNVASKCGFTGQYKPLQALHSEFNKHGFEVVAFPCNQFGKQEPQNEPAINNFCKQKFGIKFDMFAKVNVNGDGQAELFKRLTCLDLAPAGKGKIHWNFEKFIVGKDGKPCARFRSNVSPKDKAIVSKIREALGIEEKKEDPKDSAEKATGDKKPEKVKSDQDKTQKQKKN